MNSENTAPVAHQLCPPPGRPPSPGPTSGCENHSDYTAILVRQKHAEYYLSAKKYRRLAVVIRLVAAISAGVLPAFLDFYPVARALSLLVVLCIAIDSVIDPKRRWSLYSRATDRLAVALAKRSGQYEQYRGELEAIRAAESEEIAQVPNLREVISSLERN